MLIKVLSREEVEAIKEPLEAKTAVISIRSKESRYTKLHSEYFDSILNLTFKDDDSSFTSLHAIYIFEFVNFCFALEIEELIIHCYLGVSRSPAIAQAIKEQYSLCIEYEPRMNKHVYDTMKVLGNTTYDE